MAARHHGNDTTGAASMGEVLDRTMQRTTVL
jgi:hypothetical protein